MRGPAGEWQSNGMILEVYFSSIRLPVVQGRKGVMNNSLSRGVPRLKEPGPTLQLLASVTLVFLLAFGADVLLQWAVGLFVAGIVEQDTFFYSAVKQQDAFAQTILASIKLVSFVALGVGFVATLVFLFIPFYGRSRLSQAFQSRARQLLKVTLLSLRGIVTIT